ncbi:hypothetical protein [Salinisphaera sp. Q1T1-3]|uniref:hypothetical protein n=1 Tax=Salinisphaera sp. Q1T1-3 TaxID=2321229 RepID=UPI000E75EF7F|nr:hypothetical protein [Salinisphaera sp. Q1T1-3]RJS91348.1 hypothetical protein D3260_15865 [Salinisphaera sp. Q1T1-3]
MSTTSPQARPAVAQLDEAIMGLGQMRQAHPDAPNTNVLAAACAVLAEPDGPDLLYQRVRRLESAGVFAGTDWNEPVILQADIAKISLRTGDWQTTTIEALSQLRLLAVAKGDYKHPRITARRAHQFMTQVMALNLDLMDGRLNEADRERSHDLGPAVASLYAFELATMGYESILDSLVAEVWRILDQRPIDVDQARGMVIQIAHCLYDRLLDTENSRAAALVDSLFSPTPGCREDPGLSVYNDRLADMQPGALADEAAGFAEAMHATGLVSDYHAIFLRHLLSLDDAGKTLIPAALGLSSTGRDALGCYAQLVYALITECIYAETAQAIYGLACLLERGVLYSEPVAAGLWRQIQLPLSEDTRSTLRAAFGDALAPRVFLLAGVLSLLGQPLGVGQGNNPTCQSVIGVSMWAANDPDYLLQLLTWAARDDEILFRFEGETISSKGLAAGLAKRRPLDVDPVSMILVPHLDRIYIEMGRLCGERDDDLHRWIHPEFYGWWVGQGFRVVADPMTDRIVAHADFVRQFYASYHPEYNNRLPVIHPQPAGIAATDSAGRYIGRHAITILRVALDPEGVMRVYFFNPNNDSGQDWGLGVVTSTHGHGEYHGEASLPFTEFASRLFVYHFDPLEKGDPDNVPETEVLQAVALAEQSWGEAFQ